MDPAFSASYYPRKCFRVRPPRTGARHPSGFHRVRSSPFPPDRGEAARVFTPNRIKKKKHRARRKPHGPPAKAGPTRRETSTDYESVVAVPGRARDYNAVAPGTCVQNTSVSAPANAGRRARARRNGSTSAIEPDRLFDSDRSVVTAVLRYRNPARVEARAITLCAFDDPFQKHGDFRTTRVASRLAPKFGVR